MTLPHTISPLEIAWTAISIGAFAICARASRDAWHYYRHAAEVPDPEAGSYLLADLLIDGLLTYVTGWFTAIGLVAMTQPPPAAGAANPVALTIAAGLISADAAILAVKWVRRRISTGIRERIAAGLRRGIPYTGRDVSE